MTLKTKNFHKNVLDIDPEKILNKISNALQEQVYDILNKRGAVVAMSGGIDSSVCAALATHALGKENVLGLSLPEKHSSDASKSFSEILAEQLEVEFIVQDIEPTLSALECYKTQTRAVQKIFPQFDQEKYKFKIILPQDLKETGRLNIFRLVIETPDGKQLSKRLPQKELMEIVAATNHKQRTRKQFEYFHADRLNYAVIGTPNRLEYDQGFFVKGGDGLADIKPIAHLYKTQVYSLADYLGLPDEILNQKPTTDTYSLSQTQEEFYFVLPYNELDLVLWALNHDVPADEVGEVMGYTENQIRRVYADIQQKRRTTRNLHLKPLTVEPIPEIETA